MAAVLACGQGAVLSHRSAAALWGLVRASTSPVEVTGRLGRRRRPGIALHEGGLTDADRDVVAGIPVTSVARTLLDLADVLDERQLENAFEEADRLGLLRMRAVEEVCARSPGRRGLKPLRRLAEEARAPEAGRTRLEDRLLALCREHCLPAPHTNVEVLGREVDAFWPEAKLTVEADSWAFHRHRAAFEDDRARDAKMQVEGYRVLRLTHRRMKREPDEVAAELRRLLGIDGGQSGQGTVEWVALLAVVALVVLALVLAGTRVPGAALAREIGGKLLCAAALADRCGDEPVLIAAYGDEVGRLVREHMPAIAFERGARALPVDFRRCRAPRCGDGTRRGLVARTDAGLPVTAFVHAIDCREGASRRSAPPPDCSGERAGNLYIQYWLYYADSATMRGVPVGGARGYHRDDWESVQVRIRPDGAVDERASSHHGYNHAAGLANAGSDAGMGALRDLAESSGLRPRNGWGPSEGLLRVSGGSHAGNVEGWFDLDRIAPTPRIHLVPLEPVAAAAAGHAFAVTPPWRKRAWSDPEAIGTD
jgi:very-short-patch-repair endonuclease